MISGWVLITQCPAGRLFTVRSSHHPSAAFAIAGVTYLSLVGTISNVLVVIRLATWVLPMFALYSSSPALGNINSGNLGILNAAMYQDLASCFTVSLLGKFFSYQSLACPRS